MEITLVGTGSPVPIPERGGTSIALDVAGERVLIDCGPRTVYGLMEARIPFGEIETMFFTHHHMDHNASFFHFAFTSWTEGGRESLTVYGPDGTDRLVDALYDVYAEDIEYRQDIYPTDGISNIETGLVTEGFSRQMDGWSVEALPVEHSIETYAYRFEEAASGSSFVFSGDTRKIPSLAEFAEGADVLVQDCNTAPVDEDRVPEGDDQFVWQQHAAGGRDLNQSTLTTNHCDATDAGEIAQAAGVETLVLTHVMPYRDLEAMRRDAEAAFDGDVIVAEDGLTVAP
ncbi:Ribonuclease BN, tRNA processing enzyme [Halomicrobium zhouii]|uniref:Ribonuclease BN, tRNA processing enzyme n=1 Tax=Halomicrobium zhouii TaxID=767519 RepID=A0A1I6M4D9_9EURY|nr:MBL fold metallo-hydrolase [Halomicrobium zhouii]SFS10402.1 Ribonuclease BN, tRNA processing enzyme [Halomicrobium zhouii]